MSRPRTISVSALNIAIENRLLHSPSQYAQLFQDFPKKAITVEGERNLYLEMSPTQSEHHAINGRIIRTTSIEAMKWYNTRTKERVPEEGMKSINIPDGYEANYREYFFLFELKSHCFLFETEHENHILSPRLLEKFFKILLSDPKIRKKYGPIHVSVEADQNELEKILNSQGIRSLRIQLTTPNPDDLAKDADSYFAERLDRLGASKAEIILSNPHEKVGQIEPDKDIRTLAKVASSNGFVEARIKPNTGKARIVSTKDHPAQEIYQYSSAQQTRWAAFLSACKIWVQKAKS